MKAKTTRSLWVLLVTSSFMMLVITGQIIIQIVDDRPFWFTLIFVAILPVNIFSIVMISMDLFNKELIIRRGKLMEKDGTAIKVMHSNGKIKKYRIHHIFEDMLNEFEIGQEIQVELFRRTKAITHITK
jgi:hypothetical protein